MNVKESFKNSTQRQIAEGVAIHGSKDTVTMNHKYEWVKPVTSKLVVSRQVGDGWRTVFPTPFPKQTNKLETVGVIVLVKLGLDLNL